MSAVRFESEFSLHKMLVKHTKHTIRINYCISPAMQIVKGIDAVTREQLVRTMAILGLGNPTPVFGMVPTFGLFKPAGLVPTITEEDRVILNNVQTILEFLTAGSSMSRISNQVLNYNPYAQHLSIACCI